MDDRSSKILKFSWILKKGYEQSLDEVLRKHNLTRHEGNVLLFLHNYEFNTAHAISRNSYISKSLVSLSINSLNERKYLEIKGDKKDKRTNILYITEEAKEAVADLNLAQNNFYKQLEKDISKEELELMDRVLSKLYDNVHTKIAK